MEWEEYAALEPFGEVREDYRNAYLRELVHNMLVSSEHRRPLKDFLLRFEGEGQEERPKRKTWQEMKKMAEWICLAYNAPGKDM